MNPLDIFIPLLLTPLTNILLALYHLADGLNLPGQLGWAIIFLTILVNLVVYPLKSSQLKGMKKLQELRPHLAEIKRKHGHDRKRHQEETMKLYSQHGYNPASGCVPLLLQFPVLIGLYNVFFETLSKSPEVAIEKLNEAAYIPALRLESLNESFFGLSLAVTPSGAGLTSPLILVAVLTGLLQLVLMKMSQPAVSVNTPKKEGKETSFEDALASSQGTFLYIFPVMIGYFAYTFPVGLSLYWNVSTIFAIIQQYIVAGPGGLVSWLPKNLIPANK